MKSKIYKGDIKTSIVSKPDTYIHDSHSKPEIIIPVIKMPPKKRYTVNLIIKSRKKAEFKKIIQEILY